ncbi:DNA-binding protein [Burkholderia sp. HI2714]|uniref:DNA-binding protein n=1 Tax=Burkholderia sp. HI2714 TaxID=2015359 RepID=UPI000B79FC9E|nr:DNA-binding protein [Burkholderia sp. HI2714]OXJ37926.1 DNA-binding protein [Burkholderia sp. HI2714]
MTTTTLAENASKRPLSTKTLAALLDMRPESILKAYMRKGSYFGLRPVKLPNGRLMWPADSFEKLTGGQQ